jgi:uncharacterized protein with von Willebrand factor type A (vWA) domain
MIKKVVEFSGLLRDKGIPASIRSTQKAYQAAEILKRDDDLLKEAFASIYLKDQNQRKKFEELFDSFFGNGGDPGENSEEKEGTSSKNILKSRKFLKVYNYSFEIQDPPEIKMEKLEEDKIDYTPPLDDYIPPERDNSDYLERDITTLNSFEPELFDLCQKLGRKIANRRVRRHKKSKKMRPDIRRTIRKNLKHGGAIIDLVRSKPKIKKSDHFFLTDVSGSCDWISNWFFCMVYAAQNSFHKARTFDFDNKTVETTLALEEPTLLEAFMGVRDLRQKNLMIHGSSNMFQSFKSFTSLAKLNRKSVVIILSDCRDWAGPKKEGRPLSADLIRFIADRSRKVLVLNPEPEKKWDVVDSCVSPYKDAGAEFFEVRNLEQLANLITEI